VYIDDGATGDSGELHIDVDGHEYVEQENYSYAQDGVVDSVSVDTPHGGHLVYTDTGHTGTADLVTEYDGHGGEIRSAHYDAEHWAADHTDTGASAAGTATQAAADPHSITVDTAGGPANIGPATVDTNNDGRPDTAVVHNADGSTVLYTDSHGDGHADVATEITADGHVVIAQHSGDHGWTEVQRGHLDANGTYHQDSSGGGEFVPAVGETTVAGAVATGVQDAAGVEDKAADEHWSTAGAGHAAADDSTWGQNGWAAAFSRAGSAEGVVRIDATTGLWLSQN
jgi:hypothetical protein